MRARCDRGGHSEWGAQQKSARAALLLGTLGLSASPAFADYFRDSIGPDSARSTSLEPAPFAPQVDASSLFS